MLCVHVISSPLSLSVCLVLLPLHTLILFLILSALTLPSSTSFFLLLPLDALSPTALSSIFLAKGRPSDNPLIVHIHSFDQFHALTTNVSNTALRVAHKYWPGPITLVVPSAAVADGGACDIARAHLSTVAIRMPNHPIALALLRSCQLPLAAPSANLSGRPSPTTAQHVWTDLQGRIAGIIDGGEIRQDEEKDENGSVGVESTVVECSDDEEGGRINILRPGGVTREMLEELVGKGRVTIDPSIEQHMKHQLIKEEEIHALPKQNQDRTFDQHIAPATSNYPDSQLPSSPSPSSPALAPKAPGMKYQHYAPRAPLILVDGSFEFLLRHVEERIGRGEIVGILTTEENRERIQEFIHQHPSASSSLLVSYCGSRSSLLSVARALYSTLRYFDSTHVQIIYSEIFDCQGVGEAVMNRLTKAAGGKCLKEGDES